MYVSLSPAGRGKKGDGKREKEQGKRKKSPSPFRQRRICLWQKSSPPGRE